MRTVRNLPMMYASRLGSLFVVLLIAAVASGQTDGTKGGSGGGSIQGSLPDLKGSPTLRGLITWTRQLTSEKTTLPPSGSVVTDAEGGFVIGGLAAGTYAICVRVPNGAYLDPCEWGEKYPQVELKGNQKVAGVTIALVQGTRLTVTVQDSEQKLKTEARANGSDLFARIILPNGRSRPVFPTQRNKDGQVYELIAPMDQDLPIVFEGQGLAFLEDGRNKSHADRAAFVSRPDAAEARAKEKGQGEAKRAMTIGVQGK